MSSRDKDILTGPFIPQDFVAFTYLAVLSFQTPILPCIFIICQIFIGDSLVLRIFESLLSPLLFVLLLVIHIIHWFCEKSNQRRRDWKAEKYLSNTEYTNKLRAPSLFLRAFYTSNFFRRIQVRNSGYSRLPWPVIDNIIGKNIDLETLIACISERYSPLIAIGRSFALSGSGKVTTSDKEWKRVFWRLALSAKFIVHVVANRPGTKWEFQKIISNQLLSSKTFFIIPGSFSGLRSIGLYKRIRKDYKNIRSESHRDGYNLPPYQRQGFILVYSVELDEFITYPSGNFRFGYLKDLIDCIHKSKAEERFGNDIEFIKMLGPIRSNEGHYIARLVEWDWIEYKRKIHIVRRHLNDGSCFVVQIKGCANIPYDNDSIGYNQTYLIANPRIFSNPTIVSMLNRNAEFFSMRDSIILKAKAFQVATRKLSFVLFELNVFSYLDNIKRLQEKFFGVNHRKLEKVSIFLKENKRYFSYDERDVWEKHLKRVYYNY